MGYELHITRAEDWAGSEADPISQEEWEAFAKADDRLIEFGEFNWADTGPTIAFVWRDENGPSFVWRGGQVNVKGVRSDAEVPEIVGFAAGLAAALQGDDGETYDSNGQSE